MLWCVLYDDDLILQVYLNSALCLHSTAPLCGGVVKCPLWPRLPAAGPSSAKLWALAGYGIEGVLHGA